MTIRRKTTTTSDPTRKMLSRHGLKAYKMASNLETIFKTRLRRKGKDTRLNRRAVIAGIEAEYSTKYGKTALLHDLMTVLRAKYL